jgi:uncharacterized protein (DUF433 family)
MIRKRKIRPREVLDEIRSGISEAELRTKYRLSVRGVERLFNLLVANGTVDQSELFEMYPFYERKLSHIEQRWEPRVTLNGKVYVYDVLRSSTGTLRDISEKGFRAAGINCSVGESKSLLIDLQPLIKADPVLVVARCRWAETRGHSRKYITAGFEILEISDSDAVVLRSLIELLRSRPPTAAKGPEWVTCQELPLQGEQHNGEGTRKRTVKTREIAEDIHSGIDDTLLMKKYELTRPQLDCILRKLKEADLITEMQMYERTSLPDG